MQNQIKDTDDIRSLWQKAQNTQKEIQKREEELDLKILDELDEIYDRKNKLYEEEYDKLSSAAKSLTENEKNAENKIKKKKQFFLLTTIASFAVLVISRALLDDFIPLNLLVYVIMAICSLIAASVVTCIRNKKITDRINAINTNEEIKAYKASVEKISNDIEKEVHFVGNEKYKEEKNAIEKAYAENDYDGIRKQCIKKCGNAVYLYFESINFCIRYQVLVDGNIIIATSKEKYNVIKLNPGYHSFEIRVLDSQKTYQYAWQVGEENSPLFLTCSLLDATPFCKIKEISFEKFENISGKKLLPN